jgi:hypothetical protein
MKNMNLHTLDLSLGPLHQLQVFCHWTIKARYQRCPQINISSIQNYQGLSFLPVTFTGLADLFPQLWSLNERLCRDSLYLFDGPMSKNLVLMQGSRARILGVNFNIFSCWHHWETRFKSGFHSSFWDFISGIWNWGMASSFWNHVIQISIRQVHFQDIYSQLWIVKTFNEYIYFF